MTGGSFTQGAGFGGGNLRLATSITGAVDQSVAGLRADTTFTEAASGTHAMIAQIIALGKTITGAGASTTTAATIYIDAAMAGATNNYALFVDGGSVRLDSSLWVEATPTEGSAGEQLTSGGATAVMTWAAAASRREWKNVGREVSPQDGLDAILGTAAVYRFKYKDGYGTHDYKTTYTGVMAEDAPWAMHHGGGIVNPINTLGYMVLGFKAHQARIDDHEERIAELERELKELRHA